MREVRAYLLLAAAVAVVAGIAASAPARAATSPSVSAIDCVKHPALFDVIYITNGGDAQDLAGWTLRSDPEGSEQMSLAAAGSLDPGEEMIVVAGAHGVTIPTANVWLWTNSEVLRDAGDPVDYVKLYDPSGAFVSGMDCNGAVLTAAPPPPAPTQAPVQDPTTTQPTTTQPTNSQSAVGGTRPAAGPKAVPNSGGAAGDGASDSLPIVGALAALGGAALMIMGMRGERFAARISSIEGEMRADPRGAAHTPRGRAQDGRS